MIQFGRLFTAMVTPFSQDGTVDYKQAGVLANYLIEQGSEGLVVAGSTGEAATLSEDERLKLFSVVLEAVGDRACVVGGTGTNNTESTVTLSRKAAAVGLHGLLIVAPYYNKPCQEGLYRHFARAAESAAIPIIIYNVPGRTAVNILPETVVRLSAVPNIIAVKESSGSLEQMSEIIRTMPVDFRLYCGDDALTLPSMAVGAYGVISVASHIAASEIRQMIQAFATGDSTLARELHLKLSPLFKALFITTNPTAVKAALNLTGMAVGEVRLPLVMPGPKESQVIRSELARLGKVSEA